MQQLPWAEGELDPPAAPAPEPLPWPDDPVAALDEWSREVLRVPAGHPLAGQPLVLPPFALDFIRDALTHRESLLCIGRKNAKSAVIAVYLLARLAGPLRVRGWRGGVVSVNREKAGELKEQMLAISEASLLAGLEFRRSPAPGRVLSPTGTLDILSADRSAGHAAGFDDAVVDELGLLAERDRQLVNGMKSSVSSRNGRFIALSIMGDAPFTREMVELRDDPAVAVHLYEAPGRCRLDDESAWHAANPGIRAGIKSLEYMRDRSRIAAANPLDAADFRAHDLNQPLDPSRETVCMPDQWEECVVAELPPRDGRCFVGFDLGGSSSMTAAVAVWQSGRVEQWAAFPVGEHAADDPTGLVSRGQRDGVGRLYVRMHEAGELRVVDGRLVNVGEFLIMVADALEGERVVKAGADRYRRAEAEQALAGAGVTWPLVWRGQGASATADGSYDVRAFRRWLLERRLRVLETLLWAVAISESSVVYDKLGNPALEKSRARGRIDVLSAGVIAVGLAELDRSRRPSRYRSALL